MSVRHLSEYEIQEYIDNDKTDTKIQHHIEVCQSCSDLLKEYESCFSFLTQEEPGGLSASFVSDTLQTIKLETDGNESKSGAYFSLFACVLGLLAVAQYYLRFDFDLSKLPVHAFTKIYSDWSIFVTVRNLYEAQPEIFSILIFAGITILFYSVVDKLVKKAHPGKINCLSI